MVKGKLSVPFDNVKFIGAIPTASVTVKLVVPPAQTELTVGAERVAVGAAEIATGCEPKGPAGVHPEASTTFRIWKVPATVGVTVTVAGELCPMNGKLSVPLDKVKSNGPVPVVSVTVKSVVPPGQIVAAVGAERVAVAGGAIVTDCEPKGPAGAQAEASVRLMIWKALATVGVTATVAGEACPVKGKLSVPLDKVKSIGPVPVVSVTVKLVDPPAQIADGKGEERVAVGVAEIATACEPKGPVGAQAAASVRLMIWKVPPTVGATATVTGDV